VEARNDCLAEGSSPPFSRLLFSPFVPARRVDAGGACKTHLNESEDDLLRASPPRIDQRLRGRKEVINASEVQVATIPENNAKTVVDAQTNLARRRRRSGDDSEYADFGCAVAIIITIFYKLKVANKCLQRQVKCP
jgi:hypothetical protein